MSRWKKPSKEEMLELRWALATRARSGALRFPVAVMEMRKAVGLTQQQFAAVLGMTRRQIADIENGRANPTLETMEKMGRLFGFSVGYVPREEVEEFVPPKP